MGVTKKPARGKAADVIARRRLRDVRIQKDFTVWVGRPRKKGADWECLFRIGKSPGAGVQAAHGIDAFSGAYSRAGRYLYGA
jgi:hypothetical protein